MLYIEELKSGRTPLVKKAAKKILTEKLKGYGDLLHQALTVEMEKAKSWESQMYLIYAMAATECIDEISYLKSLIQRAIPTPVTYRSLAAAIVYLENAETKNLDFVYESLASNNLLQASGACAGIYLRNMTLEDEEVDNIMSYVTQDIYLQEKDIRGKSVPFEFILAASYLFSEKSRAKIIDFARQFKFERIEHIIADVTKGKDGKRIRLF